MVSSNHLASGMTISVNDKIYRVESSIKVNVPKGAPFIKASLRDLSSGSLVEKNFKVNQTIQDVGLKERNLEYLYLEGKDFLFLDLDELEQILVPNKVVGECSKFLKEGGRVTAHYHDDNIYAVEHPQFLELMVARTEELKGKKAQAANGDKLAILETGAEMNVPPFIEAGDVIKVDTKIHEYIQRV